jgi:hypothetical protein
VPKLPRYYHIGLGNYKKVILIDIKKLKLVLKNLQPNSGSVWFPALC